MEIDKKKMLDSMGKPITQSLFLEIGYGDTALYTLKEQDHEHKGTLYPSLKRLFLEMEDPTEYEFATTYLLGWKHWLRLNENKAIRVHIDEWRAELEVKLRCKGVKSMMLAAKSGNYQAAKYLADKGWETRGAGRPTKAQIEHELQVATKVDNEFKADVVRLFANQEGK